MSDLAYIYTYVDNLTGEVRYVGQTQTPDTRDGQHIETAVTSSHKKASPKDLWIVHNIEQSQRPPRMVIVDTCAAAKVYRVEYEWIRYHLKEGHRLLNLVSTLTAMQLSHSWDKHYRRKSRRIPKHLKLWSKEELLEYLSPTPIFLP